MRRDLAGHGNTLGLGTGDHVDGARRGEMLDVHMAARETCELDVAGDLGFLACGGPTRQTQTRRDDSLVDDASADDILHLAVTEHGGAEHLGVVEYLAHHAAILDTVSVVGKRDRSGGDHVAHLGELLAREPLGTGPEGVDARAAGFPRRLLEQVLDHGPGVYRRLGVCHGNDTSEPTVSRSTHAGNQVLLVLLARIAEVHVHVDHAGDEVLARTILHEELLG